MVWASTPSLKCPTNSKSAIPSPTPITLSIDSTYAPSDLRSARGKVTTLRRLDSGVILADIEWDVHGLPKRVNIKNLTKAKSDGSVGQRPDRS